MNSAASCTASMSTQHCTSPRSCKAGTGARFRSPAPARRCRVRLRRPPRQLLRAVQRAYERPTALTELDRDRDRRIGLGPADHVEQRVAFAQALHGRAEPITVRFAVARSHSGVECFCGSAYLCVGGATKPVHQARMNDHLRPGVRGLPFGCIMLLHRESYLLLPRPPAVGAARGSIWLTCWPLILPMGVAVTRRNRPKLRVLMKVGAKSLLVYSFAGSMASPPTSSRPPIGVRTRPGNHEESRRAQPAVPLLGVDLRDTLFGVGPEKAGAPH
jgi:hypothetical protein